MFKVRPHKKCVLYSNRIWLYKEIGLRIICDIFFSVTNLKSLLRNAIYMGNQG